LLLLGVLLLLLGLFLRACLPCSTPLLHGRASWHPKHPCCCCCCHLFLWHTQIQGQVFVAAAEAVILNMVSS
jgi:hypothetical protein